MDSHPGPFRVRRLRWGARQGSARVAGGLRNWLRAMTQTKCLAACSSRRGDGAHAGRMLTRREGSAAPAPCPARPWPCRSASASAPGGRSNGRQHLDWVAGDERSCGDDGQVLHLRLRHEEPIEGIAMMVWQGGNPSGGDPGSESRPPLSLAASGGRTPQGGAGSSSRRSLHLTAISQELVPKAAGPGSSRRGQIRCPAGSDLERPASTARHARPGDTSPLEFLQRGFR